MKDESGGPRSFNSKDSGAGGIGLDAWMAESSTARKRDQGNQTSG